MFGAECFPQLEHLWAAVEAVAQTSVPFVPKRCTSPGGLTLGLSACMACHKLSANRMSPESLPNFIRNGGACSHDMAQANAHKYSSTQP